MDEQSFVVPGFDAVGIAAGIKKSGASDLALIASAVPCSAAEVFTRNLFVAAPVKHGKQVLAFNNAAIYGVLINSGCANSVTGVEGDANSKVCAETTERFLGAPDNTVFVMSTGVIGVQLPLPKMINAIPDLIDALKSDGWQSAARAIMTTDTRPKIAARTLNVDGATIHITGIAKGSGMIHPNMATMLGIIATDAAIDPDLLQATLTDAVRYSFNAISVDGDTSTNDTVLLLANGVSGVQLAADGAAYASFAEALRSLSIELAQAIVRDGEGATRFVTIGVQSAPNYDSAHQIANTIATSPLVKTALFGGDANWGRILAAVGRAGVDADPEKVTLTIDGGAHAAERLGALRLVEHGMPIAYNEEDATRIFAQPEIDILIDLGLGTESALVWTTDLSYDYVKINGDYRT